MSYIISPLFTRLCRVFVVVVVVAAVAAAVVIAWVVGYGSGHRPIFLAMDLHGYLAGCWGREVGVTSNFPPFFGCDRHTVPNREKSLLDFYLMTFLKLSICFSAL